MFFATTFIVLVYVLRGENVQRGGTVIDQIDHGNKFAGGNLV